MLSPSSPEGPRLDEVEALLRALAARGCPALVMGSLVLRLRRPELLDHPPRDVDLLIPDDVSAREAFIDELEERGAEVTSWGEPARAVPERARAGRYYLRAVLPGGLVCDATYESPLAFAEAAARASVVEGLAVIALGDHLELVRARGRVEDHALLERAVALGAAPGAR